MAFNNDKTAAAAVNTSEETKVGLEEGIGEQKSTAAQVGLKFNDFEIIQVLGEGSFGKVFKVKKRDSGVIYAMKSMSKK